MGGFIIVGLLLLYLFSKQSTVENILSKNPNDAPTPEAKAEIIAQQKAVRAEIRHRNAINIAGIIVVGICLLGLLFLSIPWGF